jgi:hypothetical protein
MNSFKIVEENDEIILNAIDFNFIGNAYSEDKKIEFQPSE